MNAGARERAATARLAALIASSRWRAGPNNSVANSATAREVHERIAARLAWVRGCARLTRRQMAALIDACEPVSLEQRLWRYETGRAAVPTTLLMRVAEAFDVSVEVFTSERISVAELHTRVRRRPETAVRMLRELERGKPGA